MKHIFFIIFSLQMRSADEGQTAFYRRIRELSLSYSLYSFLAMQTSMYLKNIVVRRVLVSFEIESVGQKVLFFGHCP